MRLNKHIAQLGICSRRKADRLIAEGKVKVNGQVVHEMGLQVNPETDTVEVDGTQAAEESLVYIALNKPVDYICSASSDQGASVLELLTKQNYCGKHKRELNERVYPVGRLDKDSEGLVLLTNDGALTNTLTHPRYEHEKEYEVWIDQPLSKDAKKVLTTGMVIDDERVQGIQIADERKQGRDYIAYIILKEGKNRQIRKMFGRLGYRVRRLKRIRMSGLKLGTLPVGQWRYVQKSKITA